MHHWSDPTGLFLCSYCVRDTNAFANCDYLYNFVFVFYFNIGLHFKQLCCFLFQHRSTSLGKLCSHNKYSIQVSRSIKYYRSPSLPSRLDFETFAKNKGGIPQHFNDYAWVREIWNKWFDEVYPRRSESAENRAAAAKKIAEEKHKEMEKELTDSALTTEGETSQFDEFQCEIDRLTKQIEDGCAPAFNYCRRGALYIKMGKLKTAMDDLEKVCLKQILMLP